MHKLSYWPTPSALLPKGEPDASPHALVLSKREAFFSSSGLKPNLGHLWRRSWGLHACLPTSWAQHTCCLLNSPVYHNSRNNRKILIILIYHYGFVYLLPTPKQDQACAHWAWHRFCLAWLCAQQKAWRAYPSTSAGHRHTHRLAGKEGAWFSAVVAATHLHSALAQGLFGLRQQPTRDAPGFNRLLMTARNRDVTP